MAHTLDLFAVPDAAPVGFRYHPDLIDAEQERDLIAELERLSFNPFQFHGFEGKRRVISFGWRYDFNGAGLQESDEIPAFIMPLRQAAAACFKLPASALQQVLLTHYPAGATIGWHKDRPVFQDVIGISLLSCCTFRFRRKTEAGWERQSLVLEPRSVYLLQGPARLEWEHSIHAVPEQRYSITFRSLRDAPQGKEPR
jgi:alkylated DNA repair dioxygenase AlkB